MENLAYRHQLEEAFAQPGCAICRLVATSTDRFLDAILWESVNDVDFRAELRLARGFCQKHGWLAARKGAALGLSIMMHDVLRTLLRTTEGSGTGHELKRILAAIGRAPHPAAGQLAADLGPQNPCPACRNEQETERHLVGALLDYLEGDHSLTPAYAGSDGLCLAHFRRALEKTRSADKLALLVAPQREIWQALFDELSEFMRKNDYRFKDEAIGAEGDAWLRALAAISGPAPQRAQHKGLTQSL